MVRATSERSLPTWGTSRAILASESHWLQLVLVLSHTIKCGWAIKFVDWLQVRLNLICTKRGAKMLMIVGELIILRAIPLYLFFLEVTFCLSYSPISAIHVKLSTANLLWFAVDSLHWGWLGVHFIHYAMGGAIPDWTELLYIRFSVQSVMGGDALILI
jgi:hypothetical protein